MWNSFILSNQTPHNVCWADSRWITQPDFSGTYPDLSVWHCTWSVSHSNPSLNKEQKFHMNNILRTPKNVLRRCSFNYDFILLCVVDTVQLQPSHQVHRFGSADGCYLHPLQNSYFCCPVDVYSHFWLVVIYTLKCRQGLNGCKFWCQIWATWRTVMCCAQYAHPVQSSVRVCEGG